jgi:hypothetical protein
MQLFELIAKSKPLKTSAPFIAEGKHKLLLKNYELVEKNEVLTGSVKYSLSATFVVEESAVHPVGSSVKALWKLDKADWQLERELSRSLSFLMALLGTDKPDDVQEAGAQLIDPTQPARGIPIYAIGVKTTSAKSGKDFVNVSWEHCKYTPEEIVANRAKIEAGVVETAPVAQVAQPKTTQNNLLAMLGKR